jgi:hypothetical protein
MTILAGIDGAGETESMDSRLSPRFGLHRHHNTIASAARVTDAFSNWGAPPSRADRIRAL